MRENKQRMCMKMTRDSGASSELAVEQSGHVHAQKGN